jgi:hypothetical protein
MLFGAVYAIEMASRSGGQGNSVILLSKRRVLPPAGTSIDGVRISDTVFVERDTADVG